MNKTLLASTIVPLALAVACGKSSGDSVPHLFTSYLVADQAILSSAFDETSQSFELGWVFYSPSGGKVIELGGLFPVAGTYTVTLWSSGGSQLARANVTVSAGALGMVGIDAVTIEPTTDYIVSYNSSPARDYYYKEAEIYPLDLGSLVIKGEVERVATSASFPGTALNAGVIVGVPEIGFVPN